MSEDFGYIGFDFEKRIIDEKINHNYCHNEIKKYLESYNINYVKSNSLIN